MDLSDIYTDVINEYSRSQKHRQSLKHPSISTRGINPSCGDDISLELEVQNDIIVNVGILGNGCAISEASAAIMADLINGKTTAEASELAKLFIGMIRKEVTDEQTLEKIEDGIALQNISNMPARVKCAVLAWRTLEDALQKLPSTKA